MSLQNGILGLLTYKDLSGYELKTLFDKSINYIWEASLSQIYRELKKLEGYGHITSRVVHQEDKPDKKVYSLTHDGQSSFYDWLKDTPEKAISPKRDEFMLRLFFGAALSNNDLMLQFQNFSQSLTKYEKIFGENNVDKIKSTLHEEKDQNNKTEDLLWQFTIRRLEMTMQMLKKWSDECIQELSKLDEAEN